MRKIHHVRFDRTPGAPQARHGFLIRAGEFVKKTRGRLVADEASWAEDVARLFKKHAVESMTITDEDGWTHYYWRDPPQ